MFNKNSRKKFLEQNWLKIIETDKNPSQAYKRYRKEALQAISDLSLLASRLPDDKLYEIFNEKTLSPLLDSIFFLDKSERLTKFRQPNVKLAAFLVGRGIAYCLSEYEKWNEDTPETSKPTIEYLQRASSICGEIGYKFLRDYIDNKVVAKKNKLICIWERKFSNDFKKFKEYILQEIDYNGPSTVEFESKDTKKINEYYFNLWGIYDYDPEEKELACSIKIVFSPDKPEDFILDNNHGTITFYDHQNNKIKSRRIQSLKFGSEHALVEE